MVADQLLGEDTQKYFFRIRMRNPHPRKLKYIQRKKSRYKKYFITTQYYGIKDRELFIKNITREGTHEKNTIYYNWPFIQKKQLKEYKNHNNAYKTSNHWREQQYRKQTFLGNK